MNLFDRWNYSVVKNKHTKKAKKIKVGERMSPNALNERRTERHIYGAFALLVSTDIKLLTEFT